jgi:uncharacterized Tic20 family protein
MNPAIADAPILNDAVSDSDRTYTTLLHISGGILSLGTAIPGVIAPLVMWLIKKNDSHFIDDHGREAVNFWISMILYTLAIALLTAITCGVGAIFFIAQLIFGIICVIRAAIAANHGQYFRYPMCIRLIVPPQA